MGLRWAFSFPSRSHFCKVFVVRPISLPNSLGEYVLTIHITYYISICLSTPFSVSLLPGRRKRPHSTQLRPYGSDSSFPLNTYPCKGLAPPAYDAKIRSESSPKQL